jgi:hypothetical protein
MSNTKTTETITLVDESNVEILVNYTRELETVENGAGFSDTQCYSYVLNSCEIVIAGTGIEITKQLNAKQVQSILDEVASIVEIDF